jgi:hypothetical protein
MPQYGSATGDALAGAAPSRAVSAVNAATMDLRIMSNPPFNQFGFVQGRPSAPESCPDMPY